MDMKNAFADDEMEMEDKQEKEGVVLIFSPKDAKKIMKHCDAMGIEYTEDME